MYFLVLFVLNLTWKSKIVRINFIFILIYNATGLFQIVNIFLNLFLNAFVLFGIHQITIFTAFLANWRVNSFPSLTLHRFSNLTMFFLWYFIKLRRLDFIVLTWKIWFISISWLVFIFTFSHRADIQTWSVWHLRSIHTNTTRWPR